MGRACQIFFAMGYHLHIVGQLSGILEFIKILNISLSQHSFTGCPTIMILVNMLLDSFLSHPNNFTFLTHSSPPCYQPHKINYLSIPGPSNIHLQWCIVPH